MTELLKPYAQWRSPRVKLADVTPAVLRLPDGRRSRGELETVSLTGGMLVLPTMLDRGAPIRLMFLTQTGPVLGTAELLRPVSTNHQPFRFVALEEGDQRRLKSIVQSLLEPADPAWIRKYRAAMADRPTSRRRFFRSILLTLAVTLCLGAALYLAGSHVLK